MKEGVNMLLKFSKVTDQNLLLNYTVDFTAMFDG